ncbi:hypothetical protein LRS06_08545 [Hymenobacter sp. J193]|uniref:hypothetical protein n=1 Tax=Hymenobacter sp. J193 TaxID=2898429 RepID=UPI0021519AB1|nr:hypothetical protein [Hymenobacter sp. J193]MCR5887826.1 hypothetical protein [Hymenobacter sp. J193]
MGFLSKLFKSKPDKVYHTSIGSFTLVYSKKEKNIWSSASGKFCRSVGGTNTEPDPAQLEFLSTIDERIESLSTSITERFNELFLEAGLDITISNWQDRFAIGGVDIHNVSPDNTDWIISFDDQEEDVTYNLFVEGTEALDFSIDS